MSFTHGTRSAMRNYGCHCEACKQGNALNQAEKRERRRAMGAFACTDCNITYGERWQLDRHRVRNSHLQVILDRAFARTMTEQ